LYVAFGDLDTTAGKALEAELSNTKFVECNTAVWADQLQLFREAEKLAPNNRVQYVIANAGICPADEVFHYGT